MASAAAVAAAVGVAVPVSMSLHLNTPPTNAGLAAGSATPADRARRSRRSGRRTKVRERRPRRAPRPSAVRRHRGTGPSAPAYLPPNFPPYSVTWDSLTTGWVIGPAGTPGSLRHTAEPRHLHVGRAHRRRRPDLARACPRRHRRPGQPRLASAACGSSTRRYGWAFGPELWATDDGGEHWHLVDTGNLSVPQLETINGRAYALFADCTGTLTKIPTPPARRTR